MPDTKIELENFQPSEQWLEAFESQATQALYDKAERYATSRAYGVAKARGHDDDLYARGLVQDALVDTLAGTLRWDPSAATLETHIINSIRGRSRHDREHAWRFRHASLSTARTQTELEASVLGRSSSLEVASHLICDVRHLAAGDTDVTALLDAFAEGLFERDEILQAGTLSAKRYRNARLRLGRLAKQLPRDPRISVRLHA